MGPEGLSQLPPEELRGMIGTMSGGGDLPPGAVPVEGMEAPPPPPGAVPPGLVEAVTARLVEMGVLAQPTQEITPAVQRAIQQVVDGLYPGLLDTNNPDELMEAMNVILSDGGSSEGGSREGAGGGEPGPGGRLLLG
jgi:hypothetical protein